MNRYYILHGPIASVGVYDTLAKAQDALDVANIPDKEAWIESAPQNELVSSLSIKRECYVFDGAWVRFEEPIENCAYSINAI